MKTLIKDAIKNNVPFWVCLSVAIFLIVGGSLVPPLFVIDSSIFVATGELFLFAALGAFIKALDNGSKATLTRGDMKLQIWEGAEHEDERPMKEQELDA